MAKSHYEVLGVRVASTSDEIRSAYRKIVLEHHPDRSKDPRSAELFLAATTAYEVLGDADRRRQYDELQRLERMKAEQDRLNDYAKRKGYQQSKSKPEPPKPGSPKVTPPKRRIDGPTVPTGSAPKVDASFSTSSNRASTTVDVTRLTMLFSRGQHQEAERLARKIIERDGRQPIPYAVLGDLHRQRGELQQASKMYAYAIQMDPRNQLYQQRHEELLGAINVADNGRTETAATKGQVLAPVVGGGLVLLSSCYLVLSNEAPFMPSFKLLSTWTVGLVVMLFLCGVFLGASFSVGHLLDRFSTVTTNTIGGLAPSVALALVAVANFWAAGLMYVAIGVAHGSFNFSTSRLVGAVAGATVVLAGASAISSGPSGWQTLLWGGNLIYVGALCGWMVADSFRR